MSRLREILIGTLAAGLTFAPPDMAEAKEGLPFSQKQLQKMDWDRNQSEGIEKGKRGKLVIRDVEIGDEFTLRGSCGPGVEVRTLTDEEYAIRELPSHQDFARGVQVVEVDKKTGKFRLKVNLRAVIAGIQQLVAIVFCDDGIHKPENLAAGFERNGNGYPVADELPEASTSLNPFTPSEPTKSTESTNSTHGRRFGIEAEAGFMSTADQWRPQLRLNADFVGALARSSRWPGEAVLGVGYGYQRGSELTLRPDGTEEFVDDTSGHCGRVRLGWEPKPHPNVRLGIHAGGSFCYLPETEGPPKLPNGFSAEFIAGIRARVEWFKSRFGLGVGVDFATDGYQHRLGASGGAAFHF